MYIYIYIYIICANYCSSNYCSVGAEAARKLLVDEPKKKDFETKKKTSRKLLVVSEDGKKKTQAGMRYVS
jgi:hypothetical protein